MAAKRCSFDSAWTFRTIQFAKGVCALYLFRPPKRGRTEKGFKGPGSLLLKHFEITASLLCDDPSRQPSIRYNYSGHVLFSIVIKLQRMFSFNPVFGEMFRQAN